MPKVVQMKIVLFKIKISLILFPFLSLSKKRPPNYTLKKFVVKLVQNQILLDKLRIYRFKNRFHFTLIYETNFKIVKHFLRI